MDKAIKRCLSDHNVGVGDISSALGISRQSVYRKLESDMRMSSLVKIAKAAGCVLVLYDPQTKAKYGITEKTMEGLKR